MSDLIEEVWDTPEHHELDRLTFQYAYRSVVCCDDIEERKARLEQALLKLMDRKAAAYCMAAVQAALMGENRRCREEYTNEEPHVLNENGDWDWANKKERV
jgi:hypothetical protein